MSRPTRAPMFAHDLGVAWSPVDIMNAPNTPDSNRVGRYHVLMEDGFAACDRTMVLAEIPSDGDGYEVRALQIGRLRYGHSYER